MQIEFNVPHLFCEGSSPRADLYALHALTECLKNINRVAYGKLEIKGRLENLGNAKSSNKLALVQSSSEHSVIFDLPKVFRPGDNELVNAKVARSLFDCLSGIDYQYITNHGTSGLYQLGIVYGRTETWDSIPALMSQGFGDCKSLACAMVAERRWLRIPCNPVFRFRAVGDRLFYHVLVQTPEGFEDPSKVLGMVDEDEQLHVG